MPRYRRSVCLAIVTHSHRHTNKKETHKISGKHLPINVFLFRFHIFFITKYLKIIRILSILSILTNRRRIFMITSFHFIRGEIVCFVIIISTVSLWSALLIIILTANYFSSNHMNKVISHLFIHSFFIPLLLIVDQWLHISSINIHFLQFILLLFVHFQILLIEPA